jgi:hypothetical protein
MSLNESKDFDVIKDYFETFTKDKQFSLLNCRDDFVTEEILKFFNDETLGFKKLFNENKKIEMSKVIKGNFIVFEDYNLDDLFEDEYENNKFDSYSNLIDKEEFTESFDLLF